MKKILIWSSFAIACVFMLTSASSNYENPNGKAGVSGAPGEGTCADSGCHSSFALNSGTGSVTITSPDLTNWNYVPGNTYTISVTVAQTNIGLFGLCFEALKPSGDNAGTLVAGSGTQIKTKTVGGVVRRSITHNTNTGASSNSHTFTFTWDAPATDEGAITFYVSGMAANGNGNETGDRIYSTSQVVTSGTVGLDEIITGNKSLAIFPNPTTEKLLCPTTNVPSTVNEAYIVDMQGRTVMTFAKNQWSQQDNNIVFDLNSLNAGNYMLCLASKGQIVRSANFQKTR